MFKIQKNGFIAFAIRPLFVLNNSKNKTLNNTINGFIAFAIGTHIYIYIYIYKKRNTGFIAFAIGIIKNNTLVL